MTIAHDATSIKSPGSTTTFRGSWTHTPVGVPKGVFVLIGYNDIPDRITGVTYGGLALTRVAQQQQGSGSQSVSTLYWRGTGLPTGAQTVVVSGSSDNIGASVCMTCTAVADVALQSQAQGNNGGSAGTDLRATLSTGGKVCLSIACLQPHNAQTPTSDTTVDNDVAAAGRYVAARQTSPSSTAKDVGCTQASGNLSYVIANFRDTFESVLTPRAVII